jgi:putative chitinase
MSRINRKFFFDTVRLGLFNGKLKQSQVEGLTAFLDEWEANYAKKDDRWLAYILATVHHETDRTFRAIEEYGRGKGRKYGMPDAQTGKVYYGRGFVQLTWKANYERMSQVVRRDLVQKPELALEPKLATQICFYGMIHGSFTGKKLSDYFGPQNDDWVNARRIINGTDRASNIASYAKQYYCAISYTTA